MPFCGQIKKKQVRVRLAHQGFRAGFVIVSQRERDFKNYKLYFVGVRTHFV